MENMKQHGVFSWNELSTTDVAAAKAFYSQALGWALQDLENGGMRYTIAKQGEREVAGIMALPDDDRGMTPAWGCFVTVDDVDARVARATALGAKLHKGPLDIPGVGRIAYLTDPQGAMLALIRYFDCN